MKTPKNILADNQQNKNIFQKKMKEAATKRIAERLYSKEKYCLVLNF